MVIFDKSIIAKVELIKEEDEKYTYKIIFIKNNKIQTINCKKDKNLRYKTFLRLYRAKKRNSINPKFYKEGLSCGVMFDDNFEVIVDIFKNKAKDVTTYNRQYQRNYQRL